MLTVKYIYIKDVPFSTTPMYEGNRGPSDLYENDAVVVSVHFARRYLNLEDPKIGDIYKFKRSFKFPFNHFCGTFDDKKPQLYLLPSKEHHNVVLYIC